MEWMKMTGDVLGSVFVCDEDGERRTMVGFRFSFVWEVLSFCMAFYRS